MNYEDSIKKYTIILPRSGSFLEKNKSFKETNVLAL
jgi:hypothetical protein